MNNNGHSPDRAADRAGELVTELLTFTEVVLAIRDHMASFFAAGCSSPHAPPTEAVLHGLLSDVLKPVVRSRSRTDVRGTIGLLAQISEVIAEEIYLVPPDAPEVD